ncbi:aldo/keto reductase [Microlunatus endophyticus]|uniref:Aldo/keto reductase n=2 Tax=Microlunatus endophyticus TaxID=1716077 RepID=A0A917W3K9_9ACTN|nr:aldo/keto reductase [Microlunatus endophyticus]
MNTYYLLGRSGLRVSRLALGTMNFGVAGFHAGYGKTEEDAEAIFRRYVEAGGNFIDTADFYTAGQSERILGRLIRRAGNRDEVVLTSKFTNTVDQTTRPNPNASGNGRAHIVRAVEASLRRLDTDYLDLYLLHTWDRITPVEEVVRTLDNLVREGKIRYAGLSDVPAWYAARAQTYAEVHGLSPIITVQLPYSLAERSLEAEYVSMAQNLGIGLTAWSPLGGGLLTGKYTRAGDGVSGEGRIANPDAPSKPLTERDWAAVDALREAADTVGAPMAQVALAWALARPGITSLVTGASSVRQLESNLAATGLTLPAEVITTLNAATAPEPTAPYAMFTPQYQSWVINPGVVVADQPATFSRPVINGATD